MATRADPLVGTVVAGRYEIVRRIGKGGMGAIYEARHLKLHRSFALKCLIASLADDAEALARFQREADVVARLRHPNIVEIVDVETLEDGTPCLVMELLRGEDLGHRLARGPLGFAELAVDRFTTSADQLGRQVLRSSRGGFVDKWPVEWR